jgi:rhamnosyltransferase subunit B
MTIVVLTIGSSGDVHPFVGLALALQRRGHRVRFVTNPYFGTSAVRAGLDVVPLGSADEFRDAMADPDVWHRHRGHKAVFRLVLSGLRRTYDAVVAELADAAGPTVVVASSLAWGARIAQDQLGFPMATVHLSPSLFRSSIAPPVLPGLFMPRWLPLRVKQSIWAGGDRYVLDRLVAPAINELRAELGLPPASGILGTWWNSPDRVIGLFPEWFAAPQTDWPPQSCVTGFPRYDESDTAAVDPELDGFLDAGPPPIAFTPGTAMQHGADFFRASVEACVRLGRRGLLLTRHVDHLPPSLPRAVRHVPYAPFSRLLPRCAAVVHHGGIGTTAQALAAGVPQVVTPFAHDQFDNADRVRRLSAGRTVPARRYTARRATAALAAVLDNPAMAAACRSIAGRMIGDGSIDRTCELVETLSPAARLPLPVSAEYS